MLHPSHKKEILINSKATLENIKNQNKNLDKLNSKQLKNDKKKELKNEISKKEGELRRKLKIKKNKISKSFRDWIFNNNEL